MGNSSMAIERTFFEHGDFFTLQPSQLVVYPDNLFKGMMFLKVDKELPKFFLKMTLFGEEQTYFQKDDNEVILAV